MDPLPGRIQGGGLQYRLRSELAPVPDVRYGTHVVPSAPELLKPHFCGRASAAWAPDGLWVLFERDGVEVCAVQIRGELGVQARRRKALRAGFQTMRAKLEQLGCAGLRGPRRWTVGTGASA